MISRIETSYLNGFFPRIFMEKYLNVIFFLSALIVTGNRANLETRWNILVAAVGALMDDGGMGTNVLPLCMIPLQLLKAASSLVSGKVVMRM